MISSTFFDDVTSNHTVFLKTYQYIHEPKNQRVSIYRGYLCARPTFFFFFVGLLQRSVQELFFERLSSLKECFAFSN